ncbi:serum response factor-binding protein 1 isoform X1 [Dermacentor andersoni]|uniref:serum response factor-binding protein 1 isoform X1 n=1 Tax=Dermacentor andersoni TaxID=34620 RepID=UPI002155DDF7|nr:serum response factor-binding protein 1-like isoform X1 [Dermacentor andersoni]
MEKVAVNNLVVVLRRLLKTERVFLIRKMTSEIRKLENSKGPDAHKRRQKGVRWKDQVNYLKKVDLTTIARQALAAEEPWKNVLVRSDSTPEERAMARLIDRPGVQKVIQEFRGANTDWKEWLPKIYDAWDKRKEKCFLFSNELETPVTQSVIEAEEECEKHFEPEDRNTIKPPMRTKAVPQGAKVVSTCASKPELKKKVLQGGGKIMSKETPDEQSKGLPVQSPDRVQKLFIKMAAEKVSNKESLPRKFAAGDPFFWPAEKTGRDDDAKDEHAQKSPFSPSTKQGLPPRSSSFGKTSPPTGRHQHSTAFSPADGNSGQPQAFRKAPVSTGKRPSDRLKELDLHPSWAAKRQAQKAVVPFQGKKITFS